MKEQSGRSILLVLGGFVSGVVLTVLLTVVAMRSMMIVELASTKDFDTTVTTIEKAIKAAGWTSPATMNMNKAMAKHGVTFQPRIRLIKLCKAQYASEVLKDARHMSSLMPCTIAVYEDDAGAVKVAKMNTGLMGKIFGGTIARVMGGSVAADEKRILSSVVGQ